MRTSENVMILNPTKRRIYKGVRVDKKGLVFSRLGRESEKKKERGRRNRGQKGEG